MLGAHRTRTRTQTQKPHSVAWHSAEGDRDSKVLIRTVSVPQEGLYKVNPTPVPMEVPAKDTTEVAGVTGSSE